MTTWMDGSKTGDFAFTDHDGLPRYRGRECNLYGTAEDAAASHKDQRLRGATTYVFRTRDGLFGASVLSTQNPYLSDFTGSELVAVVDSHGEWSSPGSPGVGR